VVIHQSGLRPGEAEQVLPLDDLLPVAEIVIDRAATLPAPPEQVWPWLVQLGKDRAGWYFPRWAERGIPLGHRGLRHIDPGYQWLERGDQVLDWGPGRPMLEVVVLDPPRDLGFHSVRGKTEITWVLHLTPDGDGASRLQLRLRIDRAHDWKTPVIAYAGGLFDWLTIIGLFAGLRERLVASEQRHKQLR
jgi:hypothetical protein